MDYYRQLGVKASHDDVQAWFFEAFRYDELRIYPDVAEALEYLAAKRMPLGIISAHREDNVSLRCKYEGLHRHLRSVKGGSHNKTRDIKEFCLAHNLDPAMVMYVGDMPSDMQDAKRAGVIAVGITRGKGTEALLRAAGADHCIEGFNPFFYSL